MILGKGKGVPLSQTKGTERERSPVISDERIREGKESRYLRRKDQRGKGVPLSQRKGEQRGKGNSEYNRGG
jgi:hypothetical protein